MNESTGERERIAPKGSVILRIDEETYNGRLGNIGEHGMFVLMDDLPLDRWGGCLVDFELRFDGARAKWEYGTGRIASIQGLSVRLTFETPSSSALRRSLGQLVNESEIHARVMSVVLIDADLRRRGRTAKAFRTAGCAVVEAATPLEAISSLGAASFEPDVVAVANSLPSETSDELRSFVQQDHPAALLITVGDELLAPLGMHHWLSADPSSDLVARVRDLLVLHVVSHGRERVASPS